MSLKVELLEQSFQRIRPQADEFAASFYENLFAANPKLKPLFSNTDIKKQQKKLIGSLVLVVENLRRPEVLGQVLKDLGGRHIQYGVLPKYYPMVGEALLVTFEQYLQLSWTPEVKQAWVDAYGAIANLMLEGAGYTAPSLPSQTVSTPSAKVEKAPVPQQSPVLQVELQKVPTPSFEVNKTPTPQKSGALQVELLESSFAKVRPQAEQFAASFYENLFAANPEVKPLFGSTDMKKQQKKLISSLVLVVESLRRPEVLGQVLKDLGGRHISYGVLPKYYPMVGEALLMTFEQYLQLSWTPEVKQAWVDAYGAIANLMLEGAGYTAPSLPSQTVSTPAVEVEKAPVPQESPVLQVELVQKNKSEQIKTLVQEQIQEQIKGLRSVFSQGVIVKQIKEKFVYLQEQFVYWFWELPTWAVTLIVVGIVLFLILITNENSILGQILGSLESLSVVVAVVLFIKEIPERKKQSHYQAWSTIDGAEGVEVSYARYMALQDLNKDGVILRGIKVAGAKLESIDLSDAELSESDFHKADLDNANFNRANLNRANISFASLTRVNFSSANLSFANLKDSNLAGSNLKNANLFGADLSNARLTGVDLSSANLSAANLMGANLSGANLTDTNLNGANLIDAIVPDDLRDE
ncbi:globin domain-containing protein [Argonema galeatum]|uniref:globin domain-containing protein n=1 Tax=Argonema galeatum TaxID=2942762 RepID=UPI002012909C|nr:globin domain-containing protein [Argonema galeatum]MCL1467933.1 pentapeptide repeat-containing protein [Argonema galeatum A003/A1]